MPNKTDRPYRGKAILNVLYGEDDSSIDKIPIDSIKLPDSQPRRYFDSAAMQSLVNSVKTDGILQPLLVRPQGDNKYELVAGERRLRAAIVAGFTEVPVIVRELTSQQALHLALVENLQREDLNAVEETEGILQLLAIELDCPTQEAVRLLYRMQNSVYRGTDEVNDNVIIQPDAQVVIKVFADLGRMSWESFVSNRLPLLRLPEDIIDALRTGRIEYSKARAIAKVEDANVRKSLLETAIKEELPLTQIKSKVAALKSGNSSEKPVENLKTKIKATLNLACKSKAWHDPKKQKKFQKILAELESLLGE